MRRRQFIVGGCGVASSTLVGCLGSADTNHQAEFREEVTSRGIEIDELAVDTAVEISHVQQGAVNDEIAEIAVAYAGQIGSGWSVEKLDGIIYSDQDLVWHVETAWAAAYINGEISPAEYGDRINDTVKPTLVVDR